MELALTGPLAPAHPASRRIGQLLVIGLISFLTLVDLFAAQAILPSLAHAYGVSAATMGFAVNASTIGMAIAGLGVALVGHRIDRRRGIWMSLALLSIPTVLLSFMPDLTTFALLRVAQGVFMSSAFTLTMAYLAETSSVEEAAGALAAYVTGNVATNLFGRLMSAAIADHLGLPANFLIFAALNLAGAALVFFALQRTAPMTGGDAVAGHSPLAAWGALFRDPSMRASFAIGFLILFTFIGTFSYVNFELIREPLGLSPMALGLVYFVFVPAILTTPFAGAIARRIGTRPTFWGALAVAGLGLPLVVSHSLPLVLAGLSLVGMGTFFAQAAATGHVSRTAGSSHGAASGLYLASYYTGGLVGSVVFGLVYDGLGWLACVAGIAASFAVAALLAFRLRTN